MGPEESRPRLLTYRPNSMVDRVSQDHHHDDGNRPLERERGVHTDSTRNAYQDQPVDENDNRKEEKIGEKRCHVFAAGKENQPFRVHLLTHGTDVVNREHRYLVSVLVREAICDARCDKNAIVADNEVGIGFPWSTFGEAV